MSTYYLLYSTIQQNTMVKLAVINLTPVSVTATQGDPQDLPFFSQTQPFQQGIAHPCGIWRVDTESECHDHRQGIHIRIITIGQPDASFHLARLQHFAFVHGSDGGTECRGDYIEQLYQFHFVHPHVGGIGWYGNPAAPVHRDCCPFHRLCVIGRNVRLPCSQRRICRFQV